MRIENYNSNTGNCLMVRTDDYETYVEVGTLGVFVLGNQISNTDTYSALKKYVFPYCSSEEYRRWCINKAFKAQIIFEADYLNYFAHTYTDLFE